MKKLTIFILLGLAFQAAVGQNTFSLQLVGSGGGQTDNATYKTSWSVGEPVTATASGGSYILTQGFQQGEPSCINPTSGGTIATAQTICYNTSPNAFTNSADASGYTGTLQYQWQSSTTGSGSGFADIGSATASTYAPPALTTNTWYRRLARVSCMPDWSGAASSNVLEVTVYTNFTAGSILTTGQTICSGGDPSLIGNNVAASGGDNSITYQWQSSTVSSSTGYGNISGANDASYDPPSGLTQTTWYRRLAKDGTCNTTYAASAGTWQVTVFGTLSASISGNAGPICTGTSPGSYSVNSSGGTGTYTYLWYKGGISTGVTTSTYSPGALSANTEITCEVTSGPCSVLAQ